MSSINNKLLKLHPDTVMTIRKMYNIDKPGDMDKAIDILEEWLKKQHHLTRKEYPREYLERTIIFRKGSVERAKSQIDNMCSLRSIFPKFFELHDARNDFNDVDTYHLSALMPTLTEDHCRLLVAKLMKFGFTTDVSQKMFLSGIPKCEYLKLHDYCRGYVVILDYRDISLSAFIAAADFVFMRQFMTIISEGYGFRLIGIHTLTSSKTIEVYLNLTKSIFSPKVANRIHVHRNIESLYDHVGREFLPSDLGGCQESLASLTEQWKNELGSKENVKHIKEMSEAISIDANRIKEKLNELDLGTAGTFRSLNVD